MTDRYRRRRWFASAGWVAVVLTAAVVGVLAGRATLSKPAIATTQNPVLYTVSRGTVGEAQQFAVSATWPATRTIANAASGVVTTTVARPGRSERAGNTLYTVNLHPVVAAQGSVPSFRSLRFGDRGADVAQLQRFLIGQRLLGGAADGKFGDDTKAAVRHWQHHLGVQQTGVVAPRDLMYFPRLPAVVSLSGLPVGAQVSPGVGQVHVLGSAPTFVVSLTSQQQNLVPQRGSVRVDGPNGHVWNGVITQSATTPTGALNLTLGSSRGGPLCGSQCALVPTQGTQTYPVSVIVVAPRQGPVLPVSAIRTGPGGATYVVLADGSHHTVSILASAQARSVVAGVRVGAKVQLLGSAKP